MLRIIVWYSGNVPTQACTFIFATQCLNIVNLPVTVLLTFISQTVIFSMTEYGSVWPIDQDTLIFYGIFSVLLGALSYGMKLTMKKKDDKEPVF